MLKVMGVSNQNGYYNGNPYSTYTLHCVEDEPRGFEGSDKDGKPQRLVYLKGYKVDKIKLSKTFVENFGQPIENLVGHSIQLSYNKYGNVDNINIVK